MDIILRPILEVIALILGLFNWVLLTYILLGVLVVLGLIRSTTPWVAILGSLLGRMVEPVLTPLRRVLPAVRGLDLSVLALIFIVYIARSIVGGIAGSL